MFFKREKIIPKDSRRVQILNWIGGFLQEEENVCCFVNDLYVCYFNPQRSKITVWVNAEIRFSRMNTKKSSFVCNKMFLRMTWNKCRKKRMILC